LNQEKKKEKGHKGGQEQPHTSGVWPVADGVKGGGKRGTKRKREKGRGGANYLSTEEKSEKGKKEIGEVCPTQFLPAVQTFGRKKGGRRGEEGPEKKEGTSASNSN